MFNERTGILVLAVVLVSSICLYAEVIPAENLSNNFYFVHLTDTHVGTENNLELMRRIVEQINALPMPVQCVVHTGDIVNYGMEETLACISVIAAL